MATKAALKAEIHEILKNADLKVMSSKKVRLQLEKKLNCDLLQRKNEIDNIVMAFVNDQEVESESESELRINEGLNQNSDDEEEEEQESSRTRAVPKRVYKEAGSSDEEVKRPRKSASGGSRGTKRSHKKAANADNDEEKPKKAKGKGNGFTRPCQLSPELANLMGADALPRHEVVKKMWSMIKERNLYDPKNKQYAICDGDLLKVMGVKRFRTFGMLKYLKRHFKQNM